MTKKTWRDVGVPHDAERMVYEPYPTARTTMVSAEGFQGELLLEGYSRGQSAATIWWTCADDGNKYPMFLGDFVELAEKSTVKWGIAKGQWKFVKRGANYGIALDD